MTQVLAVLLSIAAGYELRPAETISHEDPQQWSYSDFSYGIWDGYTAPTLDVLALSIQLGPPRKITLENTGWAFELAGFDGYGIALLVDPSGKTATPKLYYGKLDPMMELKFARHVRAMAEFIKQLPQAPR